MKRIPFTQSVVISAQEAEVIATTLDEASTTLEEAAAVNVALLQDWYVMQSRVKQLSGIIVTQSEATQQIMQVNLLVTDTLARIREGGDIEQACEALEIALSEFGDAPA